MDGLLHLIHLMRGLGGLRYCYMMVRCSVVLIWQCPTQQCNFERLWVTVSTRIGCMGSHKFNLAVHCGTINASWTIISTSYMNLSNFQWHGSLHGLSVTAELLIWLGIRMFGTFLNLWSLTVKTKMYSFRCTFIALDVGGRVWDQHCAVWSDLTFHNPLSLKCKQALSIVLIMK